MYSIHLSISLLYIVSAVLNTAREQKGLNAEEQPYSKQLNIHKSHTEKRNASNDYFWAVCFIWFLAVLGTELRDSCMLDKCPTNEISSLALLGSLFQN